MCREANLANNADKTLKHDYSYSSTLQFISVKDS